MIVSAFLILLAASVRAERIFSVESVHREVTSFGEVCPITGVKISGYTWSECKEGKTVTLGCVSREGVKYSFGETFVDHQAKWQCIRDGDEIIIKPVACVFEGKIMEVGELSRKDKFYYQCTDDGQGVGLDIVACADHLGQLVRIGDAYRKDDFLYACTETASDCIDCGEKHESRVTREIVSCIINEQVVDFGAEVVVGNYIVKCLKVGKRSARKDVVGCADEDGIPVQLGDTFSRGMIVYSCDSVVDGDKSTVVVTPVGCLHKDFRTGVLQTLFFGDEWLESYAEKTAFKMQCQTNGETVGPKIVGCVFMLPGETLQLDIGYGAVRDDDVYICGRTGEKGATAHRKKVQKDKSIVEIMEEEGVIGIAS